MELNKKIYQYWIIVILALIIFWPVGLFLLYFKLRDSSKNKLTFSGTTKIIVGVCSILLGLIGIATEIDEPTGEVGLTIVMVSIFLAIGATLIYFGTKNIKEGKILSRIFYLINFEEIETAEEIAKDLKISTQNANKYISKLISMQVFNKEIQYKNGIITYKEKVIEKAERKKKEHTIKCNCCGGINTIIEGEKSSCEYCGMELLINQ